VNAVSYNEWVLYILIFLLGLVLGMALMAGGKWKRRYREESRRSAELEAENKKLRAQETEMGSLRHAAARDEERRRSEAPGPL
jgi:cell division protein FtsB